MKICISTIQSANYGNRLQNYALQTVLQRLGNTVESVRREPVRVGRNAVRVIRDAVIKDRFSKIRAFDSQFINFSTKVLCEGSGSTLSSTDYDAFIIGSDQVWNPYFPFNSEADYLPMAPSNKKIAYAASFGVSKIIKDREKIAELLRNISSISVREDAASATVKELTGRDAQVVLDPTLLINRSDWSELALPPKPARPSSRYILKYFLGNDAYDKEVNRLADRYRCAVVNALEESFRLGPREFIWLVKNSQVVCTDSFHASVFSLLFHIPLIIFERSDEKADMSSRFDTLSREFNLDSHRFLNPSFSIEEVFEADWDNFERCLREYRERSEEWLSGSLRRVEENA